MGNSVTHRLLRCINAMRRVIGPELALVDDPVKQFQTYQLAWARMRVALIVTVTTFTVLALSLYFLASEFLPAWWPNNRYGKLLVYVVSVVTALVPYTWFLRRRYRFALRCELSNMGIPICIKCGYNLSGNASGICPECGTAIPDELKRKLANNEPEPTTDTPEE